MADTSPQPSTSPVSPAAPVTSPATQSQEPIQEVASDEKIFAVIGYFAFLFLVPLIVKPKSKFCQHHAKQSMVMFLLFIIILVFLAALPWLGSIFTLGIFALYILAIYRAYRGDYWNIPVISTFSGKINLATLYASGGVSMAQIKAFKENAQKMSSQMVKEVQKIGSQEEQKPQNPSPPASPSSTIPPAPTVPPVPPAK